MPGRLFPKSFEGQAPIEFGRGAHIIKTRMFDLTVARNLEQIEIGGSCIWAVAATSLTAVIDFRVNDQLRDPLSFQQGMFVGGIPFSRVYASHAAQPGETITVFFAVEEDVAQIRIVNPSLGFTHINVTKATVLNTVTDVVLVAGATTEILPANPARRECFIHSLIVNVKTFRIGDAATAAARGVAVVPGETIIITSTEGIHGFNPAAPAGDENVCVTWTED